MKRPLVRLTFGAFLFGFCYSVTVVWYYLAVGDHDRNRAAVVDLLLGFLAIGSLQAWEASGRRFAVLVAEVLGMAVGTYWAAR